jgi:hypothetical protein
MIPVSGNPDGQYVICDSQNPGGIVYFVQEGSDEPGSDIPLYGTLTVEQVGEEGAEGAAIRPRGVACCHCSRGKVYPESP